NHVDEVSIARRHRLGIAGQGRDDTFLVIADLPRALGRLLLRVVREVCEIAAHEAAGLVAMPRAGVVIEIGDLFQAAVAHRSGKRRHDQPAAEPRRALDRGVAERDDSSEETNYT